MSSSDWISISGILVNAAIGIVLVVIVSKRISNKRALKDYFISEIKDIRDCYRKFLNELFAENYSFNSTNSWFQVINMRLTNLETALKDFKSNIPFEAKSINHELREIVTDNEDFNNASSKDRVSLRQPHKQEIIRKHSEISLALMKTIVKINNQ
jgi:hypothetical protein